MKNAAMYARVSTSQQMEEGSSLESQVATLTRLASEKGYKVPREFIFEEDWSGEDLERPELDQLRTVAREGLVSAIFVYSNDRLSRDPLHFLLLVDEWEKEGLQIFFAQEPLDTSEEGKLIAYVRGYAGKLEAIRIRDRSRRGLRARAEKGLIVGGYHRYGYRYIPGKEPGQGIRVVNERETDVIRQIFKWALEERLTAHAITIRLQEQGIPTPRGGSRWYVSTVNRILRCREYIGQTYTFRTKGVEPSYRRKKAKDVRRKRAARNLRPSEEWVSLPGASPPIVSEEVFMAVQHQLRQNALNSPRNRKHQYLLSGRIKCGCGWSMRGLTVPPRYVYYRCRRCDKEFGPDRCTEKSVKAREVESLVWGEVKKALSSPEAILATLQRRQETLNPETLENELQAAKREVDRLRKQERNLIYLYTVGEYDKQLLDIETRRLKEAQAKAESRYEELKHRLVAMSQVAEQMESIETYCEWASQNLENLDFEQKRFVLEALDVQVIVDGKKVMIRGFLPIGSPSFIPASSTPRHRPGLGFAPG